MIPPNALPLIWGRVLFIATASSRPMSYLRAAELRSWLDRLHRKYAQYPGAKDELRRMLRRSRIYVRVLNSRAKKYIADGVQEEEVLEWVASKLSRFSPHITESQMDVMAITITHLNLLEKHEVHSVADLCLENRIADGKRVDEVLD